MAVAADRPRRRSVAGTLGAFGAALLAFPHPAARPGGPGEVCPYCKNDPKLLAPAGLVSHGPFPFGTTTSEEASKQIGYAKIYWLESAHHRIGSILGAYLIPDKETKRIRKELKELESFLPAIDSRTRTLDPWLRVHLYARRAEKFYASFLDLLGLKEGSFPDGKSKFNPGAGEKYMGEGPYLGEKDKYDLYLAETLPQFQDFLMKYFGLGTRKPQRWNVIRRDAMFFGLWAKMDALISDTAVHCCLVHNLGHNYLDGFKHYSYDLPVWLTEGFGHWAQRAVDPAFVNYDNIEGSAPFRQNGEGWPAETRRIIQRGRAAPLADLTRKNSFAELDQNDHIVIWSKVDFLISSDRAKFAALLDRLKGRVDEQGYYLSKGLPDVQREAIRDLYGWTYGEFEEAWKAWVLANYAAQ